MSPLTVTDSYRLLQGPETVYDEGDRYFDALVEAIAVASSTINLEVYIFDDDCVGQRVCHALINAAKRGVDVRVIMDAVGSFGSASSISDQLVHAGVKAKVFHPLPWQLRLYPKSIKSGNYLNKSLYFLRKINRRDHRKLCVIDSQCMFTGSFNLSDSHLPESLDGGGWRDLGVKIIGARAQLAEKQFDAVWNRREPPIAGRHYAPIFSNLSSWTRHRKNLAFERLIIDAQHKIWITSAYFAPSARVIRALKRAVGQKVDVRIIVPARSDIHLFPFLTATYYKDLLQAGIKMYEYLPSVLHTKSLIADDCCVIGSTNFNHRSFLHDLELDIVLTDETTVTNVETIFKTDIENSRLLDELASNSSAKNWFLKLLSRTLRYWM